MGKVRRGRGLVQAPIKPPPKTNSLQSKKIEEKKAFFDTTMGKVVAIGLVILVISAPFIAMGHYGLYEQPKENEWAKKHCYAPLDEKPLATFEPYAQGFVHNGMWILQTDRKDTYSCMVNSPSAEAFKNCGTIGEELRSEVLSDPPLKKQVFTRDAFKSKGCVVARPSSSTYVSLAVNPRLRENYEKALKIAEQEVLASDFSERDIEAILKRINETLLKGIDKGGNYRNAAVVVQPEDKNDLDYIKKEAEKHFGQGGFETFISAATKVHANMELTPVERQIFDHFYYTPPPPEEVPARMQQFVAEYKEKLRCLDEDPFDFAAWVHMKLVDIHPYEDAHGREARIMMNAELMRAGYAPIIFFDDTAYTEAIKEDHIRPGAFADHLRQVYDKSLAMRAIQSLPEKV